MRRRAFLFAGASALLGPTARAQPASPVIGFVNSGSPEPFAAYVNSLRDGLKEAGYIEGRNVAIEFRWARGRYELLPALVQELIDRRVSLIVATGGTPSAKAATVATSTIPIVFGIGDDAVEAGVVESLSRPGRNATGISLLTAELEAKRLELLGELVPSATKVALLVNPGLPHSQRQKDAVQRAALVRRQEVVVVEARGEGDFAPAFESLAKDRVDGLVVASDPFFNSRRDVIISLAKRARLPAIYEWREFAIAGGLASYGASLTAAYRQFGIYAGRILAGAKPGDLPVLQPSQFELVINSATARELGIEVPLAILARADEVIE